MTVNFDPILFSIPGTPISVRWYGLMYVIGFVLGGYIARKLSERGFFQVPKERVDSLVTHVLIGMFLGARIFYVFIYNWDQYKHEIWKVVAVWEGGLSFHGALAGILVGGYVFARRNKISWAQVMDVIALVGTPGLFFGRMGNFINGELYGRIAHDVPWAMIFPAGGPLPRHPSQLYEAIFEGLLLSCILWFMLPRVKHYGIIASTFLMGYATFRYFIEFFREADSQLGYYFGGTTTMGQILCLIMFGVGIAAIFWVRKIDLKIPEKSL